MTWCYNNCIHYLLINCQIVSKEAGQFFNRTSFLREFQMLHTLNNSCIMSYYTEYIVITHCDFNFNFSNDQRCSATSLWTRSSFICILLEVTVQIVCSSFYVVVCLVVLKLSYFGYRSFVKKKFQKYFLTIYGLALHISEIYTWQPKIDNFDEIEFINFPFWICFCALSKEMLFNKMSQSFLLEVLGLSSCV